MIDTLLLTVTQIKTFVDRTNLTKATGFFFKRGERLFLVTSRHVLLDDTTKHQPDRIEIYLHTDPENMSKVTALSILLYENGKPTWREGTDTSGNVDVVALELNPKVIPEEALYRAFTPQHLLIPRKDGPQVEVGTDLLAVGFPLGFHDTLHKMPVVRRAIVASSFGLRFQGMGYFMTDARTHRGISGAPIVMRVNDANAIDDLPWAVLGIHSSSFDMTSRDAGVDDVLGLNSAWYADILMTLTES